MTAKIIKKYSITIFLVLTVWIANAQFNVIPDTNFRNKHLSEGTFIPLNKESYKIALKISKYSLTLYEKALLDNEEYFKSKIDSTEKNPIIKTFKYTRLKYQKLRAKYKQKKLNKFQKINEKLKEKYNKDKDSSVVENEIYKYFEKPEDKYPLSIEMETITDTTDKKQMKKYKRQLRKKERILKKRKKYLEKITYIKLSDADIALLKKYNISYFNDPKMPSAIDSTFPPPADTSSFLADTLVSDSTKTDDLFTDDSSIFEDDTTSEATYFDFYEEETADTLETDTEPQKTKKKKKLFASRKTPEQKRVKELKKIIKHNKKLRKKVSVARCKDYRKNGYYIKQYCTWYEYVIYGPRDFIINLFTPKKKKEGWSPEKEREAEAKERAEGGEQLSRKQLRQLSPYYRKLYKYKKKYALTKEEEMAYFLALNGYSDLTLRQKILAKRAMKKKYTYKYKVKKLKYKTYLKLQPKESRKRIIEANKKSKKRARKRAWEQRKHKIKKFFKKIFKRYK